MNTIRSLSASPPSSDYRSLPSTCPDIGSSPGQMPQESTSGKKKHVWKEPSLNSELSRSGAIRRQTGRQSSVLLRNLGSPISHRIFTFVIIFQSGESLKKMLLHLLLKEQSLFTGETLELGKVIKRGKKQVLELTLKTLILNGGMVTEVSNTLSLMNFEEQSRSVTYLDGSINTLFSWKEKVEPPILSPPGSGSPPTSTQDSGTEI